MCGRALKVGRPKGYEDEALKLQSQQKLSMAQTFAAQVGSLAVGGGLRRNPSLASNAVAGEAVHCATFAAQVGGQGMWG